MDQRGEIPTTAESKTKAMLAKSRHLEGGWMEVVNCGLGLAI